MGTAGDFHVFFAGRGNLGPTPQGYPSRMTYAPECLFSGTVLRVMVHIVVSRSLYVEKDWLIVWGGHLCQRPPPEYISIYFSL